MKLKAIIYSILAMFAFVACNDDLSPIGNDIQSPKDKLSMQIDTISFESSTQIIDSIFVKTSTGLLGNFYDPTYGEIQYGYLCNFYTAPSAVFVDDVIDDRIDSVILKLKCSPLLGDPFTAMEVAVYGIQKDKSLNKKNFYNNIDPWLYADKDLLWAKKLHTARDFNVTDSAYNSTNYTKTLSFYLPVSEGQRIYDQWKNPEGRKTFEDLDKFFEFFPGVYIESTYGSGNILVVDKTWIEVYYDTHIQLKKTNGEDSTIVVRPEIAAFPASYDVTQLSKFRSKKSDDLRLVNTDTATYLKTPAGVVTQLEIDLRKIAERIGDRFFNNVKLTLEVEDQKTEQYTLPIPSTVLLINRDSVKPFFEESRLTNNNDSYYTFKTESAAYKYDFGNISNIIEKSINRLKNQPDLSQDQWLLKLWVIPVEPVTSDGKNITATHYFRPSGAVLKNEDLKLIITTSTSTQK